MINEDRTGTLVEIDKATKQKRKSLHSHLFHFINEFEEDLPLRFKDIEIIRNDDLSLHSINIDYDYVI